MEVLLNHVFTIALDAGKEIMAVYGRGFTITEKADHSPLTEADQRAHQLIQTRLSVLTPEIPILSEEASEVFAGPNAEGYYPKSGSYPATVSRSDGSHGGSGRVILATT